MWQAASWLTLQPLCVQLTLSAPALGALIYLAACTVQLLLSPDLNLTKGLRSVRKQWEEVARKGRKSEIFSENGTANEGKKVKQGLKAKIARQKFLLRLGDWKARENRGIKVKVFLVVDCKRRDEGNECGNVPAPVGHYPDLTCKGIHWHNLVSISV